MDTGPVIIPEATPNPNSTRFSVNRVLLEGPGRDFPDARTASISPLARELFLLPAVSGVYIGKDFVTVTTSVSNAWAMPPLVIQCIQHHLSSGQPAIQVGAPVPDAAQAPLDMSPVTAGILHVLETEIRPAVAMDGGDIVFNSFENGVLKLQLRGSCHSCPSSLNTLKNGIETRLKRDFPEVVSVEAI